jgi:hypothetical protein
LAVTELYDFQGRGDWMYMHIVLVNLFHTGAGPSVVVEFGQKQGPAVPVPNQQTTGAKPKLYRYFLEISNPQAGTHRIVID